MKITGILLTFVMLVAMFAAFSLTASAADGDACVSTADCTGTYANGFCTVCDGYEPATPVTQDNYAELGLAESYIGYYAITNAGNLYWFADLVDNENAAYKTAKVVLTADITVNQSGEERRWNAIGSNSKKYSGTFDGQGYTVSGLFYENDATTGGYIGLIATLDEGGVVKNVTVADSYLCGYRFIGAIVGSNNGGTIENCHNDGTRSPLMADAADKLMQWTDEETFIKIMTDNPRRILQNKFL